MDRQLVVSHYEKELGWTEQFRDTYDIIVYNKGPNDVDLDWVRTKRLPNFGREPHTYFYHIIDNYDNLAEQTVFVQDRPVDSLTMTSFDILHGPIPLDEIVGLGALLECDASGFPHHPGNHPIPVDQAWGYLFEDPFPGKIAFVAGAQMAVPKKNILARGIHFWEKAIYKLTENPIGPPVCQPPWTWCYERLIKHMFEDVVK